MKKFFALSRMQHALLDIAMPGFCALLLLGGFPDFELLALSIFTAACGYIAIYALNDLAGFKADKQKFSQHVGVVHSGYAVEASTAHHPVARGLLSYRAGFLWMASWFIGALLGAYFLHPIIIMIFLLGALLEFIYCRLLKVTYWRVILSGFVKTCGPCAAIFAVVPTPDWKAVVLIFLVVFFWEVGGQNIPADWNDAAEDLRLGAKTIPVCLGPKKTATISLYSLMLAVIFSAALSQVGAITHANIFLIGTLVIGGYCLLRPAFKLYQTQTAEAAARLFDSASYYPLILLLWIFMSIFVV